MAEGRRGVGLSVPSGDRIDGSGEGGAMVHRLGSACVRVLLAVAVSASLAVASHVPDDVRLTMEKGPGAGEVTLRWTGGNGTYSIFRSTSPDDVDAPGNGIGTAEGTSFVDSPPAGTFFYEVRAASCASSEGCPTGFCVDGVCCDSACVGTCRSCSIPGSAGTCTLFSTGTDPDSECGGYLCTGSGGCTSSCFAPADCAVGFTCDAGGQCVPCAASDLPDLGLGDENCDGIDGDRNAAIFVDAVSGSDLDPGTHVAPKRTLAAAISAAAGFVPPWAVYASRGVYAESVVLDDGVSIYGGYDAAQGWQRDASYETRIVSPTAIGVDASGLTLATELQLLTVISANATGTQPNGDGISSVGVRVRGSSGTLTLRAVTVTAGSGSAGAAGAAGGSGTAGSPGGSALGASSGAQGSSACGAPGGLGGQGVGGPLAGGAGQAGTQASGGAPGAPGGSGGSAGTCSGTSSSNGGAAPPISAAGQNGAAGTPGGAGASLGSLSAAGDYAPPSGGAGSTGTPGGGGGGGGAGGGTASGTNFICTDCSALTSGGGGGGGGGGCGGSGGVGGRGGGGSFAVVSVDATVVVESCTLETSPGGSGGSGGGGGQGGSGGGPGAGAAGASRSNHCVTRSAGSGAAGTAGGSGGRGGGAAGGSGGPSICVAYEGGAVPVVTGTTCETGLPGSGGSAGAPNGSSGTTGTSGNVVQMP